MTAFLRFCTVLAVSAVTVPLAAQDKGAPIKPVEAKPAVAKPAEMAEDVEILRLLLNKSVGLDYHLQQSRSSGPTEAIDIVSGFTASVGLQSGSAGTATVEPRTYLLTSSYPQFDGVYLNRHGVAFTVRLATLEQTVFTKHERSVGLEATCLQCHKADNVAKFPLTPVAPSAAKPPTDWEKARDELRGSVAPKGGAPRKSNLAEMCRPGNFVETVVKLLAENGRNLRHLPGDESVTVVLTYDGITGLANDQRSTTLADPTLWNAKAVTEDPYSKFGLTADESKQIVLGDLHMKQSKYADAAKAYELALGRFASTSKSLAPPKNVKPADWDSALKDLHASVTAAYRSLAQAYIGVGNLDEAKRALELAQKIELKFDGESKPKGTPVPAKIVLSVKKFHLDAAGTLTPADFRKGVTVEMVGLNAIKK